MHCWLGVLTFEFCCSGEYAIGNPSCWDADFTWQRCCLPEFANRDLKVVSVGSEVVLADAPTEEETSKGVADLGDWTRHPLPEGVVDASTVARHNRKWSCVSQYDDTNFRKWFLGQSGIPTCPMAAYGNPAGCSQGGHSYWWASIEINQGVVTEDGRGFDRMRKEMEFGFCVPKSCDFAVVEFLLLPFFLGPYLNKPWGPKPPWQENLAGPNSVDAVKGYSSRVTKVSDWATTIKTTPDYMQTNWPYNTGLWLYQENWSLSSEVISVIFCVSLPLLMAGLCECARHCLPGADRHCLKPVWRLTGMFAPQQTAARLAAPRKEDSAVLHVVKIVLQVLVCWQHAVFLMDWTGHEGHIGISTFAPRTHGFAQMLGRVNTCFACLSAHLVVLAVSKLSRGRHPVWCVFSVAGWCLRRWIVQVFELAVWTFYYLRVAPDIPWRPHPEFVQVWYHVRVESCFAWPSKKHSLAMPMWLLSVLLIYEPVNSFFGWFRPSSSLCHNLSIFEVLFSLSCLVAMAVAVRHCCGFKAFAATVGALVALTSSYMPIADAYSEIEAPAQSPEWKKNYSGGEGDWRWQVLPNTVLRLLPASLLAALVSAAFDAGALPALPRRAAGNGVSSRRVFLWCVACSMIAATFVCDFMLWTQSFAVNNWRLSDPFLRSMAEAWRKLMTSQFARPLAVQRLLALLIELPLVLGLALVIQLGENRSGVDDSPCWLRVLSRLSIGINIANIFVLHYISGRHHDHSVEFSQVHLASYTFVAWSLAAFLSILTHMLAAPYAALVLKLCGGFARLCRLELEFPKSTGSRPKPSNGNSIARAHNGESVDVDVQSEPKVVPVVDAPVPDATASDIGGEHATESSQIDRVAMGGTPTGGAHPASPGAGVMAQKERLRQIQKANSEL